MPPIGRARNQKTNRRREVLRVTVANAIPIVGVVALGWNAAALLLLYWLELGVDSVWALVRAVFAGRPPALDTDGLLVGPLAARQPTLSVPGTSMDVYLVTLVGLPLTVLIVAIGWLFAGAVLVGPTSNPSSGTLSTVVLAAIGLFVVTGITTLRTYFHDGEYRKHNSQTAFSGHLFRIITVFVGGLVTVAFVTAATEGPSVEISRVDPATVGLPLLLTIALGKFTADFCGVYSDRLAVYFESYDQEYGWFDPPPEPEPVEATLDETPERVRPVRLGRVFGGPLRLPYHMGCVSLGGIGLVVAGLFALGQAWQIVTVVVTASVAVPCLLMCLDQLLRYGTVEYRIAPDDGVIVAYDRLFGTALWRLESWAQTDVRVETTPVDTLLGTETVSVDHPDGQFILPHLPDSDPVLAISEAARSPARRLIPGRRAWFT
ncbi:DUF6498-containing protein [Haloarcula pellucida]|uniref:Uncharacterized protein n=1 Tax=Haloarcula pellucida TaxID=1427151 RepID=A0A830GNM7_9EURY|nr:DUF6498-containing protein [Halomicroarcula pellucida]MBX0349654.1 hypothetical protein [Halomicroarcula pellucida]GGN95733.1 hypothetical protein GCM10009030_23230 [Halomicroarcula pellucida]